MSCYTVLHVYSQEPSSGTSNYNNLKKKYILACNCSISENLLNPDYLLKMIYIMFIDYNNIHNYNINKVSSFSSWSKQTC